MNIKWDNEKSKQLKRDRGVSFEDLLVDGAIIDVIENPNYKNQKRMIISYNCYIYAVPFVYEDDEMFLKTLYPSRKLYKTYSKELGNE